MEIVKHKFDLVKFNTYFNDFKERNRGWYPRDFDKWLEYWLETHAPIIEAIGGEIVVAQISLDNIQKSVNIENLTGILKQIKQILPNYFKDHNLEEEVLLGPTIDTGTHNYIKTSKHISNYASKQYISDADKKLLNRALAELGDMWSNHATDDIELQATLSVTPKSFLLLGHYGPDRDSCFRQGSDHPKDKFLLSQTHNSFVFTISYKDLVTEKHSTQFRCWGVADLDNKRFALTNFYNRAKFNTGNAIHAFRMLANELFNDEFEFIDQYTGIRSEYIYLNKEKPWVFYTKDKNIEEVRTFTLNSDQRSIYTYECDKCHKEYSYNNSNFCLVDNSIYCRTCAERHAQYCPYTDTYTTEHNIIWLVDKERGSRHRPIQIREDIVEGHVNKCKECDVATVISYNKINTLVKTFKENLDNII